LIKKLRNPRHFRISVAVALPKYHVSAGTFHVSTQKALLLQAFLGTCVGVALHCKSSGVGGIIHLLLPEPISANSYSQPEKYAATGLPLLIQALVDAGARRESLSASLAGGALVGPLHKQDLQLDIGGRTVEVVRGILGEAGIRIVQSETGGFFTCSLTLDMRDGRMQIEPAGQSKLNTAAIIDAPGTREIQAAIARLKPIPQVALKILRLVDQNQYDIEAIASEIRNDQVITAKMLRLANSAMFGAKRVISSLDHAVVYLGRDLLVRMILSAAVQAYFEQSAMGYALCKGGIYHHAIGCALTAEALARRTQCEDPARAYTAGLLHDIGKVVLDQYVADLYPLFYREVMEKQEDILSIENRLLGMNHTQAGSILAQRWSFPPALAAAVREHHHPQENSEHGPLCTIVYLSDLLMSRFHSGLELEKLETLDLPKHLRSVHLADDDFSVLVDSIPPSVFTSPDADPGHSIGENVCHASQ
jgi:putative nucleotidyltransferase with HDIG domain